MKVKKVQIERIDDLHWRAEYANCPSHPLWIERDSETKNYGIRYNNTYYPAATALPRVRAALSALCLPDDFLEAALGPILHAWLDGIAVDPQYAPVGLHRSRIGISAGDWMHFPTDDNADHPPLSSNRHILILDPGRRLASRRLSETAQQRQHATQLRIATIWRQLCSRTYPDQLDAPRSYRMAHPFGVYDPVLHIEKHVLNAYYYAALRHLHPTAVWEGQADPESVIRLTVDSVPVAFAMPVRA